MKNDIIFHEVYGVYYQAIGQIVNEILSSNNQSIGKDRFTEIISDFAFQESSAKSEGSKLLAKTVDEHRYRGIVDKVELEKGGYVYRTSLKYRVQTPLTTLEKRWLKTISSDPRIKLFDCVFPDLSGVEPLYHDDDIYYCGQYTLGDDYESEKYVSIFKTVRKAISEKRYLIITYTSLHKGTVCGAVEPQRLQYSIKEDRFRLIALMDGELMTFNLSRMESCEAGDPLGTVSPQQHPETTYAEVLLSDNRSTLERFLLFFSNYERRTKKLDNGLYQVRVSFPKQDATEVLVNVLSFSPMAKIIAPEEMKQAFMQRIQKQKDLLKTTGKEDEINDGRAATYL